MLLILTYSFFEVFAGFDFILLTGWKIYTSSFSGAKGST
jgi:hypothetical protein